MSLERSESLSSGSTHKSQVKLNDMQTRSDRDRNNFFKAYLDCLDAPNKPITRRIHFHTSLYGHKAELYNSSGTQVLRDRLHSNYYSNDFGSIVPHFIESRIELKFCKLARKAVL